MTATEPADLAATYAAASRRLLRDTVLDAIGELLAAKEWPSLSMAAIASHAGVSRQTLYNEFGSRDDLALAYALREADRFLSEVEAAVRAEAPDMVAALGRAFDVWIEAAAQHPVLAAIAAGTGGDETAAILASASGTPLLLVGTDRLASTLKEIWPEAPADDVDILADVIVRLAISEATMPTPGGRRPSEVVVHVLRPFLDQVSA